MKFPYFEVLPTHFVFHISCLYSYLHIAAPRDQGKLPEWMTDGPTSQLDTMELTGFQDIEEEKKGSFF